MVSHSNYNYRIDGEVAAFLAAINPEKLAAFRPSIESQQRLDDLLDKHKDSGLTAAEKDELDHILVVNRIVSLAKARALQLLNT